MKVKMHTREGRKAWVCSREPELGLCPEGSYLFSKGRNFRGYFRGESQ